MTAPRPTALRIGTLSIRGTGVTQAEAHRLAEALPAALDRAFAAWPATDAVPQAGLTATERQALRIARRVVQAARLRAAAERGPE